MTSGSKRRLKDFSLEEIAERLRAEGYTKQAALVMSASGELYVRTLATSSSCHPKSSIITELQNAKPDGFDLYWSGFHSPRTHRSDPLKINIDQVFTYALLERSAELFETIEKETSVMSRAIRDGFRDIYPELTPEDEDTFRIFGDEFSWVTRQDPSTLEDYTRAVEGFRDFFETLLYESDMRPELDFSTLEKLDELFGEDTPVLDPEEPGLEDNLTLIDFENPSDKVYFDSDTGKLTLCSDNELYRQFIDGTELLYYLDYLINRPDELKKEFDSYISESARKKRLAQHVLEFVYEVSNSPHATDRSVSTPFRGSIDADGTIIRYRLSEQDTLVKSLLKSSLDVRRTILSLFYKRIQRAHSFRIGIEQILAGGPVAHPDYPAVSTLQNHFGFPNIQYPARTLEVLGTSLPVLKEALDDMPDISDLVLPKRMRNKRELEYSVEELPKDPLDVTFGNDAGCCISVNEDPQKMMNGVFVPAYIFEPSVRLFAVYRNGQDSKKRMGLVLAFDAKDPENPESKYLACNSVELSRLGISGGIPTIAKITQYVEDWLVGYAKEHGYAGVVMGAHSYNTSVNFSSKRGKTLDRPLYVRSLVNFYSDILTHESNFGSRTRDAGCYVLWDANCLRLETLMPHNSVTRHEPQSAQCIR